MVGMTPLTRSLPIKDEDTSELLGPKEEDCLVDETENMEVDPESMMSDSGIILSKFSSSLTTANIGGLFSVLSSQQLSAKVANLSTHSDG